MAAMLLGRSVAVLPAKEQGLRNKGARTVQIKRRQVLTCLQDTLYRNGVWIK